MTIQGPPGQGVAEASTSTTVDADASPAGRAAQACVVPHPSFAPPVAMRDDCAKPLQITMSPSFGNTDFSAVANHHASGAPLDPVSLADLLRHGFVHAPQTSEERRVG